MGCVEVYCCPEGNSVAGISGAAAGCPVIGPSLPLLTSANSMKAGPEVTFGELMTLSTAALCW